MRRGGGSSRHTTSGAAPTAQKAAAPGPPKLQLPPPLTTRAGNRTAHPGAIDAPTPRRSSNAAQAERAQKQSEKRTSQARQAAAIARVAAIEDKLIAEELEYNGTRAQSQLPQRRVLRIRSGSVPSPEDVPQPQRPDPSIGEDNTGQ